MYCGISRVARNLLLICLRCFFQFPGYTSIVVGGDRQLFPLAGMFAQLECLGVILACPLCLRKIAVADPHCPIPPCKIRIKLDGTLIVWQGCRDAFLVSHLYGKAECFQSFE